MAYFLKPLTYNSQIAGYLVRCYPGKWVTIDAASKQVLGTFDDAEILVGNTNTQISENQDELFKGLSTNEQSVKDEVHEKSSLLWSLLLYAIQL